MGRSGAGAPGGGALVHFIGLVNCPFMTPSELPPPPEPNPNLGRNEPCWCRSGKKYKKCHLDRDTAPPANPFGLERDLRKHFQSGKCLHPLAAADQCSGGAIASHTIRRAADLAAFAEAGHVMGVSPNFKDLTRTGGVLHPQEIGVNRASTFPGFCSRHDAEIFKPLETAPFTGTLEQCFLLAYRCVAKELYLKRANAASTDIARLTDKGKSLEAQAKIQDIVNLMALGTDAAIKELEEWKAALDSRLLAKDLSGIRAWVVRFAEPLFLACSGPTQPSIDLAGNELQDVSDLDLIPQWITVSFLSAEKGSACVIAWDEERSRIPEQLIGTFEKLPVSELPEALVRYCFACFENTYFSPRWWTALPNSSKDKIIALINVNIWQRREKATDFAPDGSLNIPLTVSSTSRVGW